MMNIFRSAKTLGEMSGWTMSNLPAQKLIYLAHLTHLGEGRSGSIVTSNPEFEAWDYGPVSPRLYHKIKAYGTRPYVDIFSVPAFLPGDAEYLSLMEVYDQLKDAAPGQLINITHWHKGAWAKKYRPGVKGIAITNEDIVDEYRAWEQSAAA